MPTMLLTALMLQAATTAPPAADELWMVYGGDYATRSAMQVSSIRREGTVAHTRQVVVGRTGALKAGTRTFDYVLLDVDYDCAAVTARTVAANFYARDGKLLWTDALDLPAKPAAASAQPVYYMKVACAQPIDRAAVPNPATSLADAIGANIWWKTPVKPTR